MCINLDNCKRNDITSFLIIVPSGFTGEFYSQDKMFRIYNNAYEKILKKTNTKYMIAELCFLDRKTSLEYDAPSLNKITDTYCSWLSLLYGKCIYNAGILTYNGKMLIRDINQFRNRWDYSVYTNIPRCDYPLELDLSLASADDEIKKVFSSEKLCDVLRLYYRAVWEMDRCPDYAYMCFIGIGEALAANETFADSEFVRDDENLAKLIQCVEKCFFSDDKEKMIRYIRRNFFHIKRKFVLTILKYLDNNFNKLECENGITFGSLNEDEIENILKRTYNLRSKYIHVGADIEYYVTPYRMWNNEVVVGAFMNDVDEKGRPIQSKLDKCAHKTLTLTGLERIMRYVLLSYIKESIKAE